MKFSLYALLLVGFILLPGQFLSIHKSMKTLCGNGELSNQYKSSNANCLLIVTVHHSVVGLNLDYVVLNVLGHSVYGLFNLGLYWIPSVQVC